MSDIDPFGSNTIASMNKDGLIEVIDIATGKVLAVQSSTEDLLRAKKESLVQVQLPSGEMVWVERGLSLDRYHEKKRFPYSETIIDIIATKIMEGRSLKSICLEPGMPSYAVLSAWRRKFPYAERTLIQARQDYAEILREEVVEEAMMADEGNVQSTRLRMDALKWAASVDNADRFGNKTKVVGDKNAPLTLVVDTGIRRQDDEKDVSPLPVGDSINGIYQAETHPALPAADACDGGNSGADHGRHGPEGAGGFDRGSGEQLRDDVPGGLFSEDPGRELSHAPAGGSD